ncbi:MAG: exodeoxyribonuclease VII large subunit [Pseudomonadota bacterium]
MDLIDDPRPGENAHEYSVSEISGAVKKSLEAEFGRIRVKGEVGRVVRARSGHMYFDVKDDRNSLACTTWKGQVARLSVVPEEGMEVVVTGKMTAYGAQSKYNMNVDDVAVAGVGALMAMLEKRKTLLAGEGLFDQSRKQPIPFLPEIIGVVTSPTGAVIRDILHRLRDRFPRKVLVWPVAVQGQNCAPEVARAIEGFNSLETGGALPRPDVIIVARGGGSIEDLWGFNEEIVARAAAASDIPLISAVGHETDTTLIDFVSDQRAPTPTAAAELAVPVRLELMTANTALGQRAQTALVNLVTRHKQRAKDLARAFPQADMLLSVPRQRLDYWDEKLPQALRQVVQTRKLGLTDLAARVRPQALRQLVQQNGRAAANAASRLAPALARVTRDQRGRLSQLDVRLRSDLVDRPRNDAARALALLANRADAAHRQRLAALADRLHSLDRLRETLGYTETLKRGYAVVRGDGDVVTGKAAAQSAKHLEIQFADGRITVAGSTTHPKTKAKPAKSTPPEQGSLL